MGTKHNVLSFMVIMRYGMDDAAVTFGPVDNALGSLMITHYVLLTHCCDSG